MFYQVENEIIADADKTIYRIIDNFPFVFLIGHQGILNPTKVLKINSQSRNYYLP
jgi:hypothetical protein